MTTIAIVGAGPGLGLAVARRFGGEGFAVALISRNQEHVDGLSRVLAAEGITARGFSADVCEPASLRSALSAGEDQLGPVEVLQYSPVPAKAYMRHVLDTSAEDLRGPVEFSVYGVVTAANAVLPGMRSIGRGTIVMINGASAVRPRVSVAGTSVAFAAESAYGQMLHDALADEGIHVAQLIIPRGIGAGEPSHEPAVLAERIWRIHSDRGPFRTFAAEMDR